LHVITLRLPSLRERKNDIPLLIEFYSQRICHELRRPIVKLPEQTLALFMEYDWPGNVRELVNELRRVIILQSQYSFDGFKPDSGELEDPEERNKGTRLVSMEKQAILKALDKSGGNKSRAATLLGIARRTLYQKLKRHNLD
jgi:DNA-binding NtrC family response regulator